MDGLIILAKTEAEGFLNFKQVLQTASDYGLDINFKKMPVSETKNRIFEQHNWKQYHRYPLPSPLLKKVKAFQHFPEPKNIKQLQLLLRLTGYFWKFILQYTSIARPLSDFLWKSSNFEFGPDQRQALHYTRYPIFSLAAQFYTFFFTRFWPWSAHRRQ